MAYTKEEILDIIKNRNAEMTEKFGKSKLSISKVLDMLKTPFDKEGVSLKTFEKHYDDESSEYYHMTQEQILEKWSDKAATSVAYGKKLDDYIGMVLEDENTINDLELWKLDNNFDYDERLNGICNGFNQFYDYFLTNTDYKYVAREIPFLYEYNGVLVNGRIDYMAYSPSRNKFLIIDWKNNEKIPLNNRYQKLLGPMTKYDDCDGNRYTLQLQFYKTALINSYNLDITENDVDIRIVQMIQDKNANNVNYNVYKENIPYDKANIDKSIDFGNKKNMLLNRNK